jgi:hypothetical protein
MAAHERKQPWLAAATAYELGASGLERGAFRFEPRHRIARPHRDPFPDRHDRARPERRTLGQVVDVHRAAMRLKKERPRGHRGSVNYDVAIGMRTDFDRGSPQRKCANAAPGAAQTQHIAQGHGGDIDQFRRRLRRRLRSLSSRHRVQRTS